MTDQLHRIESLIIRVTLWLLAFFSAASASGELDRPERMTAMSIRDPRVRT